MEQRNCVTLVCNGSFLPYAEFVADQLLSKVPDGCDIVICSAEDLAGQIRVEGVQFRQIEVGGFFDTVPTSVRLKQYTYWRIPAIEALAASYSRILYLDSDVFVAGQDVASLLDIDMQGAALAAVRDVHQRSRPNRMPRDFAAAGVASAPYFNAGVLLIDGQKWREDGWFQRVIAVGREQASALTAHDQSMLNIAFYREWLELAPIWNWQYSTKIAMIAEFVCPEIIHIAGEHKLWNAPDGLVPRKYIAAYRDFCGRYGRDMPPEGDLTWNAGTSDRVRKVYLKGLWYLPSTLRYLQSLPTPLSTHRHSR